MKKTVSPASRSSEQGIVSIMVTLVLMIVITLIVLGFAQLSRREQRQSLDRQLSAQAFLAAESGVNDARDTIFDDLKNGNDVEDKDDCGANSNYPSNPVLDAASNVEYTCLLVSTEIKDIEQPIAADGTSVMVPIHPASGTVSTLEINWRLPANPATVTCPSAALGQFKKNTDWTCQYGVLRVDLVPTDVPVLQRDQLMANQKATFMYPTNTAGTPSWNYAAANARGAVTPMACNVTSCRVTVSGLGSSNKYALRLSSIYKGGTVNISARDASGSVLNLKDAQVIVDSTGKAQDVLRRIRVRFSILPGSGGDKGEYALQSGSSICKRFSIIESTGSFSVPGDIADQAAKAANPTCVAASYNVP